MSKNSLGLAFLKAFTLVLVLVLSPCPSLPYCQMGVVNCNMAITTASVFVAV